MELEGAVISEETKECFTQLCHEYDDVFSKNNQDIGKTSLIEMEIDTGDTSGTKSIYLTIETL